MLLCTTPLCKWPEDPIKRAHCSAVIFVRDVSGQVDSTGKLHPQVDSATEGGMTYLHVLNCRKACPQALSSLHSGYIGIAIDLAGETSLAPYFGLTKPD
jgi:hypothetical protein